MEVSKMITISTGHIMESTNVYLSEKDNCGYPGLAVYDKEGFGYYIYLPTSRENDSTILSELPKDLALIFMFARHYDADIICLDCDGNVESELPVFEW